MEIRRYGRDAVLVELPSLADVVALQAKLRAGSVPGIVEVVPAARTILVGFDRTVTSAPGIAAWIRRAASGADERAGSDDRRATRTIPVRYDGPDLAHVAETTGLPPGEVVRRHVARDYVVAFLGFAPGFYFLAGGDPCLAVDRRDSPRTNVPRGAVGLAGEFTGIYPRDSPGGWQVIGHTAEPLWDLDRFPSARLAPGDGVRFRAVDR